MSESSKKLLQAAAGAAGGEALAIEDVFSTYLYTGNGSTQTITNGIDLAGKGGLVWIKNRTSSNYGSHYLRTFNPNSGKLDSASNGAQNNFHGSITTLNNGFQLTGDSNSVNQSGVPHVSWTFRKAPRFFDVVTYTGDGASNRAVPHSLNSIPGMIIIKSYSNIGGNNGGWAVMHNNGSSDLSAAIHGINLNRTDSNQFNTTVDFSSHITSTTFNPYEIRDTGFERQNINGVSYVAYLFAHDPLGPSGDGSDGLIECGSFLCGTFGGSASLPFSEAQWALVKNATGAGPWFIVDNMRGLYYNATDAAGLLANTSDSEQTRNIDMGQVSTSNGELRIFGGDDSPGDTYIYIAIRRGPMRAPESGTEVFNTVFHNADNSGLLVESGFTTDAVISTRRSSSPNYMSSRLTAGRFLETNATGAEVGYSTLVGFDQQDGLFWENWWGSGVTDGIDWMFRRAPGFFDVVAYSGNSEFGRTIPHNLGVAPDIVILKRRDSTSSAGWPVSIGTNVVPQNFGFYLNSNTGLGTGWTKLSSDFTSTTFTVSGGFVDSNANGGTYIAYLFATLAGVSKVGSYTGNGSSQTINCGFTSGARFILIKRTDSTGDWYVWDTARGIVTGNDPFLELNTTDAEVTSDDSIDPDSSGFIVNQTATTNVNVSSASYIFLAIA